jgi:DNA-binding MarR family transcriptional regulator
MKRNIFNVKAQPRIGAGEIFFRRSWMARDKAAKDDNAGGAPKTRRPSELANNSFARSYLAYLLARASFTVSSEFHATLKNWDLSVPEWRVLACLMDVEGLSVGELAAMALMKQPRLTKVLDRMERDDLVKRKGTTNDRRRVTIHLTAKGRARAKPALIAAKAHEDRLLKQFSRDERATIKHALDLLIDSRGEQTNPSS